MKSLLTICCLLILALSGCDKIKAHFAEQRNREMAHEKWVAQEYSTGHRQALNNEAAGFLKIYAIATDCDKYSTEYCEVAGETLNELLYSNTAAWIHTFSKVEQAKLRKHLKHTLGQMALPEGIRDYNQLRDVIIGRLKKTSGDVKEKALISFIIETYSKFDYTE